MVVALALALSSKAFPVSAVTVWFSLSMFITLTIAPGLTDAGTVYLKLLMWMTATDCELALEDEVEAPGADDVDVLTDVDVLADVGALDVGLVLDPAALLPPEDPQAAMVQMVNATAETASPSRCNDRLVLGRDADSGLDPVIPGDACTMPPDCVAGCHEGGAVRWSFGPIGDADGECGAGASVSVRSRARS